MVNGMIVSEKRLKVTSPEDVTNVMTAILRAEGEGSELQEHVWAIGLNQKLVIQYIDLVSIGTVSQTIMHPREVFRRAIVLACSAIIVCHNHPSGELELSDEDIAATKRLSASGEIIGIELADHVVFCSNGSFVSMQKEGLLWSLAEK